MKSSRYRQNIKFESFTSLFGRLRQRYVLNMCYTCRTTIFLHSTDHNIVTYDFVFAVAVVLS